jgi:hypothetical protein
LITPVGDAEGLGRRLADLASDRSVLQEMGRRARAGFLEGFTLGRSKDAFLGLYDWIVSAR